MRYLCCGLVLCQGIWVVKSVICVSSQSGALRKELRWCNVPTTSSAFSAISGDWTCRVQNLGVSCEEDVVLPCGRHGGVGSVLPLPSGDGSQLRAYKTTYLERSVTPLGRSNAGLCFSYAFPWRFYRSIYPYIIEIRKKQWRGIIIYRPLLPSPFDAKYYATFTPPYEQIGQKRYDSV